MGSRGARGRAVCWTSSSLHAVWGSNSHPFYPTQLVEEQGRESTGISQGVCGVSLLTPPHPQPKPGCWSLLETTLRHHPHPCEHGGALGS